MQKSTDPRHLKRIQKMQAMFAGSFSDLGVPSDDAELEDLFKNRKKIDGMIEDAAPQFPVDKIAKIDVAILRLAVYEMVIDRKVPFKVIIDEAVELAKQFGSDTSSSFINGVLGTIHNKLNTEK